MNDMEEWTEKVKDLHNEFDLSKDEDLSIALMNVISLEEHLSFSAAKSGNERFLEMLQGIRTLRKELLKKFVKESEAEEWCISKHLLAASMRLFETGSKELDAGKREEAQHYFDLAFHLYSLFFALNWKIVEPKNLQKTRAPLSGFSELVKKLVDCCKE